MAARAYWKGQIRLALVSIPVEIFSATKSGATIAFNQIHEPTGKRLKYEKVVPGIGPVDPDEIVRSEEHTSELQSRQYLVCRLLLENNRYPGAWITATLACPARRGRWLGL